ncbi:MAG: 2-C-methyl-D-erythritol 4-phosphate cytidylyltransferase [Anaerorhabdus sp.]
MNYSVVIVAAGKGTRMNLGYNKVFYPIDTNKTILDVTMDVFINDNRCKEILVVSDVLEFNNKIKNVNSKCKCINGGKRRQDSVVLGLNMVSEDYVLIHDGARPYLEKKYIDDILNTLKDFDACLLGVKCKDTIKVVHEDRVIKTLRRSELINAQTPQAFKTELIKSCYKKLMSDNIEVSDDASVIEMYSDKQIKVVDGSYKNKKITTIEDLSEGN